MSSNTRLVLIALFAAALAGCGGGGESASQTGSAESATPVASAETVPVPGAETSMILNGENLSVQPADATDFTEAVVTDSAAASTGETQKHIEAAKTASIVEMSQPVLPVAAGAATVATTFDTEYTSLAPGWSVNWWGTTRPTFSASREVRAGYVANGTASQRFRLNSVATGSGAHLIFSYGFSKDKKYRATIKVRSDVSTKVEFQIRRNATPYNVLASKSVTVGTTWQTVQMEGVYAWSDSGALRVIPLTVGNDIYLDDMTIESVTTEVAKPVAGGLDLLAQGGRAISLRTVKYASMDSDFSRFDPAWYFNSSGGTAQATFVASRETRPDHVYAGASSQLFQVVNKKGGDIHLVASYPFNKGKTYHASVYLRADAPTPVQVFIRMDAPPWQPISTKMVTLTTAWQRVDLEGAYTGEAAGSVRVAMLQKTGTVWADELTISEVDKNDMAPVLTTPIPDTLFGMHVSQLGVHSKWPGLGTKVIRLWNTGTTWLDIAKTKGVWDFTTGGGLRLDMYVNYVLKNEPNADIIYTMGQTPTWASSTPTVGSSYGMGAGGAPKNMDDWRDYVRTLAKRYAGRIRYWELWNEPDFIGTYNGSWENMVEMARIAKEELLAADPNNKLISPGFTTGQGVPALDKFLSLGGGAYIDIVGFHWYYSTNPESIGSSMDNVRGLMKSHGVDAKPLWNTEGAFICNPAVVNCANARPIAAESRSVNARAMFIMAAKGITNFNFHVWEASDAFHRLVESDYTTPTAAATAFAEARNWAKGAAVVDAYRMDDKVYVFRLTRGSDSFVVLWSTQPSILVNLPSSWNVTKIRTLDGSESAISGTRQITLGIEPVLLKL